jgi:hypothetical protein
MRRVSEEERRLVKMESNVNRSRGGDATGEGEERNKKNC